MSVSTGAREKILAAALHIVGTDGIPALTNRAIAARAQVSLGSITYHFPSQSDLLRSALTGFVEEETRRLTEVTEQYRDKGLTFEDAAELTERIVKDLAFSAERIAPFELFIEAGRDHALRDSAADCFAAYDQLTLTILTTLGVPDAESVVQTVVAVIAGMQLRRLATGSADQDIAAALLLLLRGAIAAALDSKVNS
ncbi:TetR/AcrR family transcriptional regulator [Rhodococcus sp. NPDC058521]|uniref:TetR/AcrR family transcriptional regulator n=1 Tax=Rhodococcus sp. NPDC058521 TaxID=3346536 RepID=UPI003668F834